MKGTTKSRIGAVIMTTVLFTVVSSLAATRLNLPMDLVLVSVPLFGLFFSSFEVFYFKTYRGRWLREMHPLKSIVIYFIILLVAGIIIQHLNYLVRGRLDEIPLMYARYHVLIPIFMTLMFIVVLVNRTIGFIGAKNLFYLFSGKYHRPVREKKVFLFLDIKKSTNIVDLLGPEKSQLLFGKFIFDASEPITNNGGEMYRYVGDGFVATWNWNSALNIDAVLQAVDDLYQMIDRERGEYVRRFSTYPDFRIGIHGGEIITSEEGDLRRGIGFYGATINIAARMEAKAKETEMDCVITSAIASESTTMGDRLIDLGEEHVRGFEDKINIFGFNRRATD